MKDTMMDFNGWSEDRRSSYRRDRMAADDSGRLKVLLLIAAVLFAFGLGLDDKLVDRLLGTTTEGISARDDRHREEVASLLHLDQARRAGDASKR